MSLRIDMGWLMATLLLSARVAGATLFAPVFGPSQIPAPARMVLVLGLSGFLVAATPVNSLQLLELPALLAAICTEALIGIAFAFGFIAAYGATQVAGRALDIQFGFGAAGVLNPATRVMSPLLGTLLGMLMIAVFLAADGHLMLVKALAASVATFPPGAAVAQIDPAAILEHSALTFSFGLMLAAPIMFLLLLADLAMAVAARAMPQLNVFVLAFAVKIVLGLTALAMSIRFADGVLNELLQRNFAYWERLATGS